MINVYVAGLTVREVHKLTILVIADYSFLNEHPIINNVNSKFSYVDFTEP